MSTSYRRAHVRHFRSHATPDPDRHGVPTGEWPHESIRLHSREAARLCRRPVVRAAPASNPNRSIQLRPDRGQSRCTRNLDAHAGGGGRGAPCRPPGPNCWQLSDAISALRSAWQSRRHPHCRMRHRPRPHALRDERHWRRGQQIAAVPFHRPAARPRGVTPSTSHAGSRCLRSLRLTLIFILRGRANRHNSVVGVETKTLVTVTCG